MKKRLRPIGLIGVALLVLPISLFVFNIGTTEQVPENDNLQELREQHKAYLKTSPVKESLLLTKAERKAQGLPPNKYFEQMWELSINPRTGKTEPENIFKTQELLKKSRQQKAPGDDPNNPWIERGPNNIGGRTHAILFDPNDSSNRRVYAGGVSGGLWVNQDITSASSQWSRVQNVPGNLSVTSITIDPRNSDIWYLGTGEQYTAGDVVGNGVYRSIDGGASWQALSIPPAGPASFEFNPGNLFLSGVFFVNDILAWENTEQNRTELYVGVGAHIYGDASDPQNWLGLQTAGLYRSIDDGATWSRIEQDNLKFEFSGGDYYYIPNDFGVAADNSLWMGIIATPGISSDGGRVFFSSNGATWTEAAASPLPDSNRVELETSTTDPNKMYALTQGVSANPVHIYRTTDRFASVTETELPNDVDNGIPANDFTRGQAFYDLMIEADPTNDDVLYVGGIDIFRSTTSGNSWSQISKWSNNNQLATLPVSFVHADQHAMTFRPGNSNQAIFGTDGGIYYASNLSSAQNSSVFGARNSNYNVTQFVKAGIGPDGAGDTTGIFTAGAQDNGTQAFRNATPGINSSEELSDGDGFYTFVDKDGQYLIATFVQNVIYRYDLPWNGLGRPAGSTTLNSDQNSGDFVNPMGYDSDANFLLTNATDRDTENYEIRTIDVANIQNADISNTLLDSRPTTFTSSPFENNVWLVGTATGGLLRLSNVGVGTANWGAITTPFVGSVSSVRYGASTNDIFVSIHNYGVVSVWYSADGGVNWINKEGDLPDIPVRDILQNPLDLTEVIVGTQLGVWVTKNFNDANPNWVQSQNGMSDASVTSFDYWAVNGNDTNNTVIASTYGRGVFTGSFTSNGTEDTEAPGAPSALAASNIMQTTLDLNWTAATDNVGVTEYDVYQDGTLLNTVTTTTYSVTGLTAGTSYDFTVRAKDAARNESADSNLVTVTTSTTGGGDICTGAISAFPYTEGFENGFGGWTQETEDDFDWIRQSGGTPSNNTGPSSAQEGDFYLYVETSTPNNPNRTTILTSPCFDLSNETNATFSFRYHMTGNAVGQLKLEASTDDSNTWTEVWSRSGDQGNTWNVANEDISNYTGGTVKFRYVGTSGNSWQGDMAVDRISLSTGISNPGACVGGVVDFPYSEGFESGIGLWTQGGGDDFDWTRNSGSTASNQTGPSGATEGSFYMYVEASNPNNPSKTTIFNSPCFDLSGQTTASFNFQYHMFGTTIGTIELQGSSDDGNTWSTLWSLSGNQGNQWFSNSVDISSFTGGALQLRWVATTGSATNSWRGDISIDDITLTTGSSVTTVVNTPNVESEKNNFVFSIYPNPVTTGTLFLNTQVASDVRYEIITINGQILRKGLATDKKIDVQNLAQGMYVLKVKLENDQQLIKQFVKR